MYSFLFTYTLKNKADRDAFLSELLENDIPGKCSSEIGCNMYRYFLPIGEENKLCIVESWASAEAQQIHTKQPHCTVIRSLKEKYGVESSMTALS